LGCIVVDRDVPDELHLGDDVLVDLRNHRYWGLGTTGREST